MHIQLLELAYELMIWAGRPWNRGHRRRALFRASSSSWSERWFKKNRREEEEVIPAASKASRENSDIKIRTAVFAAPRSNRRAARGQRRSTNPWLLRCVVVIVSRRSYYRSWCCHPKPQSAPFAKLLRNRPSLLWPRAELTAAIRLPQVRAGVRRHDYHTY